MSEGEETYSLDEEITNKELLALVRSSRILIRAMAVVVFIMFALNIAMQIQLQDRNKQLDNIEHIAKDAEAAANKASTDLSNAIESAGASAENTQAAVQLIFDIFDIVCEQSPRAEPCAGRERTAPG